MGRTEKEDRIKIEVEGGCAGKALQLAYAKFGERTNQFVLANEMGTTADGTSHEQMKDNITKHRLKYGEYEDADWETLRGAMRQGDLAVIVDWWDDSEPRADLDYGHYSYCQSVTSDTIKLAGYEPMSRDYFLRRWFDHEGDREYRKWLIAIYQPKGG